MYFCINIIKHEKGIMEQNIDIRSLNELIESKSAIVTNIKTGMGQVIVGQSHLVESLLVCLLSDGHILLEGVPGLAKTLAIKTLAGIVDASYKRIQFTPDLLPADVVGTMIYSQKTEDFTVKKGPVFANFVLADEINRAPAKVQSALLEAMQERQVTIGNNTFELPKPFLVLATQNPIEQEGTYQLPEAQVDRFMLKVMIDYPTIEEERIVVDNHIKGKSQEVKPLVGINEINEAREVTKKIYISEEIEKYHREPFCLPPNKDQSSILSKALRIMELTILICLGDAFSHNSESTSISCISGSDNISANRYEGDTFSSRHIEMNTGKLGIFAPDSI